MTRGREGNPSGESEAGLDGDLGISSERTDPAGGIEGTGTVASAQGRTDGDSPTYPEGAPEEIEPQHRQDQEREVRPDPVAGQPHDPSRNPGHSHG